MKRMKDYGIRGTAHNGSVRVFAVTTTEIMKELQQRHQTWPVVSAALGRTITASAMMAMMMKNEQDRLTVQVMGDGPIGQIVVDADAKGHLRGYVHNPAVELSLNKVGKLDVSRAVGQGTLHVVKDLGLKEPYRGSSPIVSGELGEDFAYYLSKSEQIPSAVGVGVLVDRDSSILHSGGFIVQIMPGVEASMITGLEERIEKIPSVTQQMQAGAGAKELLYRLFGEELTLFDPQPLAFQCRCSRERIEGTLKSLGIAELQEMIADQGGAEVICHFCGEAYRFSEKELEALIRKIQ